MAAADDAHMSLARRLAHSTDSGMRDRTVRVLADWVRDHKTADELEYMKLWKALYFTVWHSDKVPVQQELVFFLARLVRNVENDLPRTILLITTFYKTMQREWLGLDRLRLDKYFSWMRRMLFETLFTVHRYKYSEEAITAVAEMLASPVLSNEPNGVRYHVVDSFVDELSAALPDISAPQLMKLLRGFMRLCATAESLKSAVTPDRELTLRVIREVLQGILVRASEVRAAVEADEPEPEPIKMKFPGVSEDDPKLVILSEDATNRRKAQARAFLKLNLRDMARNIWTLAAAKDTQPGLREKLYALHNEYATAAIAAGHAKNEDDALPAAARTVAVTDSTPSGPAGKRRREEGSAAAPAQGKTHARAAASKASADTPVEVGTGKKKARKAAATPPADEPVEHDEPDFPELPTVEQIRGTATKSAKSNPAAPSASGSAKTKSTGGVTPEVAAPAPAAKKSAGKPAKHEAKHATAPKAAKAASKARK